MTTLLLAAVLSQDVDAWLRGDDAARGRLVQAGPASVRVLRKARDRAPEKIDGLILTIRAAAAPDVAKSLETKRSFESKELDVSGLARVLAEALQTAVLLDPRLPDEAAVRKVTMAAADKPAHEILDAACRDAGLDWCLTYGVVLISTPERLWPPPPPPKAPPLEGAALEQAKRLVEALNAESMEERDLAAAELEKLGDAALVVLEAGAERKEPEIASRCRGLVSKLRAPPAGAVFRTPAAERQKAAADTVKALKERVTTFSVRQLGVRYCVRLLVAQTTLECGADGGDRTPMTFHAEKVSTWAALSVVVHASGAEIAIVNGRVIVDKPEEIEKLIR